MFGACDVFACRAIKGDPSCATRRGRDGSGDVPEATPFCEIYRELFSVFYRFRRVDVQGKGDRYVPQFMQIRSVGRSGSPGPATPPGAAPVRAAHGRSPLPRSDPRRRSVRPHRTVRNAQCAGVSCPLRPGGRGEEGARGVWWVSSRPAGVATATHHHILLLLPVLLQVKLEQPGHRLDVGLGCLAPEARRVYVTLLCDPREEAQVK